MKEIARKITACFLSVVLAVGLCPAAAFAVDASEWGPTLNNETSASASYFTSDGATSSGSTQFNVQYDPDANFNKFSIYEQIADADKPLTMSDIQRMKASNPAEPLWVRTRQGTGNVYTVEWKRIEKAIPADSSWDAVEAPDEAAWSAAPVLPAFDGTSKALGDDANQMEFDLSIKDASFQDEHVYFYQASITNNGITVVSAPIVIVYVDAYTPGTIGQASGDEWQLDGADYNNDAGLAAKKPEGGILKGTTLQAKIVSEGDAYTALQTAIESMNADNAATGADETDYQTLATVTSLIIDGITDADAKLPAYIGDILVTYKLTDAPQLKDGESYVLWWNFGSTTVQIPLGAGNFAPEGGKPQVGSLQFNPQTGQPESVTFLIQGGTSASLGTFGLAIKSKKRVERFTIDAQVATDEESAGHGTITPAGETVYTYTAEDGGTDHLYSLNAYLGYQVKSLTITSDDMTESSVVIPKKGAGSATAHVNGAEVDLGSWEGNQYTLPAAWMADAMLTLAFEEVPSAEEGVSSVTAKVTTDGNGQVFLDGNVWENGKDTTFVPNTWIMLTLQGNTAAEGAQYEPQSVTVKYEDGTSETWEDPGTVFPWKMIANVEFDVKFVEVLGPSVKKSYEVTLAWVDAARGFASFTGEQATSGVKQTVEEGSSVPIYVTANMGWQLSSIVMGETQLLSFVHEQDPVEPSNGQRLYQLTIPSITEDTTVTFGFEPGPIALTAIAPDAVEGTMSVFDATIADWTTLAEDISFSMAQGTAKQFRVMPAANYELTSITVGQTSLSWTSPTGDVALTYDANGNPVYTFEVAYEWLTSKLNGAPVVRATFTKIDDGSTDVPGGEDTTTYTVTASTQPTDGSGGTVQLSASEVKAGESAAVQMFPEQGWKVSEVKIERAGSAAEAFEWSSPVYTIENITSNVAVTVTFVEVPAGEDVPFYDAWNIEVRTSGNGTVSPAPDSDNIVRVTKGYWQQFVFEPTSMTSEKYKVGDVVLIEHEGQADEVRTIVASGNTSCTITPTDNCVLEVSFVLIDPELIDPDTGEETQENVVIQIKTAVQVEFSTSTTFENVSNWRDYISIEPMGQPVQKGDDAVFTLKLKKRANTGISAQDYEYIFKGVRAFEGAGEVLCQPIYNGRVQTDMNLVYQGNTSRAAKQIYQSFSLVAALADIAVVSSAADDGLSVDDPFEAYQITVKRVMDNVKMDLVLQSVEDYMTENGLNEETFTVTGAGQLQTLYLESTGPGVIGAYEDLSDDGSYAVLKSMEAASGTVKRLAIVPNRGSYVESAMVYVGVGATPANLTGADIKAVDVTAMARAGKVSIQIGETPAVLVVAFASNIEAAAPYEVIFDNPKAVGMAPVIVGNTSYDVYTAPLKRNDGTTGTAYFYMTPKDGKYDPDAKPTFVFHLFEQTTNSSSQAIVVDELTLNGSTTPVFPASNFVQFNLSPITHFSVTMREASEGEGTVSSPDQVMMTVIEDDSYTIRPSTGYMSKADPTPFAIVGAENVNKRVRNVVDTVLIDGKVLYSPDGYDESVFEVIAGSSDELQFRIKETGEVVTLTFGGGNATVTFTELRHSHTIAAQTFRAVDVWVQADTTGGVIVPNGDMWWPVDETATATSGTIKLEDMTLYVAPQSGYFVKSFTVNGEDRLDKLLTDDAANQGFTASNQSVLENYATPLGETTGAERLIKTLTSPAVAYADQEAYEPASRYTLSSDDFNTINTNGDRIAALVRGSFAEIGSFDDPNAERTITIEIEGGTSGHGKVTVGSQTITSTGSFTMTGTEQRKIEFVPDDGYRIATVTDNGTDVLGQLADKAYLLQNVRENHVIKVRFSSLTGSTTGIERGLNRLQSLASTGDLNAPLLLGLGAIFCGALGVALLSRRRSVCARHAMTER